MAPIRLDSLVSDIHDSPVRGVLALTGGGSEAISRLLTVPGASRTVLEAIVPYAGSALSAFLGGPPDSACSEQTARGMAMAAFQRALRLDEHPQTAGLVGVGATSALATDRTRRGADRVFVAVQSADRTLSASITLPKNLGRNEQEHLVAELVLHLLAGREPPPMPGPDLVEERSIDAAPHWRDLVTGTRHWGGDEPGSVIFPGAFNPLHEGHRKMAELAAERVGEPVTLEISVFNVDKPPLDYHDIAARERGIAGHYPLVLTHAATFAEKVALFPERVFVVGIDTIMRIAMSRYYDNDAVRRDAALALIAGAGARFLVFGRKLDNTFLTLDDIDLPPALMALCDAVPAHAYRIDASSSAIRKGHPAEGNTGAG